MAVPVIMPKTGMSMIEGVVVKWLKNDGEPVAKDTPVVLVMSKKVTFEVSAPATGILHHAARVKDTLPVGAIIGYIAEPGEVVAGPGDGAAPRPLAATVAAASPAGPSQGNGPVLAAPATRRLAKELGVDLAKVAGSGPEGRISEEDVRRCARQQEGGAPAPPAAAPVAATARVTPGASATSMARKVAEEHGLDLARIAGSGPGGRVTEADVRKFVALSKPAPAGAGRAIPFFGMRQMIADRMMQSLQSMAQLTIMLEADITETVNLRQQLKQKLNLTYNDIFVKAAAVALKEHPLLNATLSGDEIQLLDDIHIGVAVALEDGLIVPVVRHADRRSLPEIAAETSRLAQGAREGTLGVDEVSGSTFTVTNLGMFGIDFGTPIINLPEVAILATGRILEKPAVHGGAVAIRSMMGLSLSFDHRVVDGAPAAAFLRMLAELLEKPYLLLV